MRDYILLTEKQWHRELFIQLQERKHERWHLIDNKDNFTAAELAKINPAKIFVPHWSYIIPDEIYQSYECIVFHMTDLPFGRGGSPLQNLIARGFMQTMLSALKVEQGIDTGGVYLKKELSLLGSATEIFLRTVPLIKLMIEEIIEHNLVPKPQQGEAVVFKRRKAAESDISGITELEKVYDHIRMMDAETYPLAFLETEKLRIEFYNAEKKDNEIIANVRITKK